MDFKLMAAVTCNEPDKVEALLSKKKLQSHKLDSTGRSALHTAASLGHTDCLHVILSHQAQILAPDSTGLLALHLAAQNGNADCVVLILQEGCPVDVCDGHGRTALHHAAVSGCLSCANILCDYQVPINIKDKDGSCALSLAAQMCHPEMCHLLLQRGADVNARDLQGRTPLMLCCEGDSTHTAHLLLTAGAQVNLVDSMGHNALHYSKAKGNSQVQNILQGVLQSVDGDDIRKSIQQNEINPSPADTTGKTPRKRKAPVPPTMSKQTVLPKAAQEIKEKKSEKGQDRGRTKPERKKQNIPSFQVKKSQVQKKMADVVPQEKKDVDSENLIPESDMLCDSHLHEEIIPDPQEPCLTESQDKYPTDSQEQSVVMMNECALGVQEHIIGATEEQESQQSMLLHDVMQLSPYTTPTEQESNSQTILHDTAVLLMTITELQQEMQALRAENTDLQDKIQILENYESDNTDMESSADFIPLILYDSLQSEYERVREQLKETHHTLQVLQSSVERPSSPSSKLIPAEAYEQLRTENDALLKALQEKELSEDLHRENQSEEQNIETQEMVKRLKDKEKQYEFMEEEAKRLMENDEKYKDIEEVRNQCAKMEEELRRLRKDEETYKEIKNDLEKLKESEKQYRIMEEELKTLRENAKINKETQNEINNLHKTEEQLSGKQEFKGNKPLENEQEERVSHEEPKKEIMVQLREAQETYNATQHQLREAQEKLMEKEQNINDLQNELQKVLDTRKSETMQKAQLLSGHERVEEELQILRNECHSQNQEIDELHTQIGNLQKESEGLQEQLKLNQKCPVKQNEHDGTLLQVQEQLAQKHEHLSWALQELQRLQENAVTMQEHNQMQESLTCELQDLKMKVRQLEQKLQSREREIELLQQELDNSQTKEQSNEALKNEVTSLTKKLSELSKRHERTSTEVFQVQREALFMKSEKQAAEEQLEKVQKELENVREQLIELQEMRPSRKLESTEENEKVTETHYNSVIRIYRTHLLSAVQGQMNEDAIRILNQILQMNVKL
uniref:Ankyrin repeat domain 24 n=1 Tax=Leptobrachium leishanense TaxID=445787 RepID=A0A8C5M6Z3_9ANUR